MKRVELEPCVAPRWAGEGHSQTIIGYLMSSPKITEEKAIWKIPLDDGDILMAEYYKGYSDYTAPAGGFLNREDYYNKCSTYDKLDKIKTPTYILAAKDDPFIPWDSYLVSNFSSSVKLHLEKIGGHMGYLTSKETPLKSMRWMDYALNEFVNAWVC